MFFIAISLSLFFGFISQTILSRTGIILSIIGIVFFVTLAVLFDMIGMAVTTAEKQKFIFWKNQNIKGAGVGYYLCTNAEKVCSFCSDVIGDICSTLCGALGACIVINLNNVFYDSSLILASSIFISSLIASLTIFFKAILKEYAIKNSNKIILFIGRILESLKKNKK